MNLHLEAAEINQNSSISERSGPSLVRDCSPDKMPVNNPQSQVAHASNVVDLRDQSAFAKIRRIVSSCCARYPGLEREDVLQKCYVKLLSTSQLPGNERAIATSYVYRVVNSVIVDDIRRQHAKKRASLVASSDSLESNAHDDSDESNAFRALETMKIRLAVRACIAKLADVPKMCMVLFLQGHSVSETARIIGCSAKRVENARFASRKAIRTCLEKKGYTPDWSEE